jgi:hypothetical protein
VPKSASSCTAVLDALFYITLYISKKNWCHISAIWLENGLFHPEVRISRSHHMQVLPTSELREIMLGAAKAYHLSYEGPSICCKALRRSYMQQEVVMPADRWCSRRRTAYVDATIRVLRCHQGRAMVLQLAAIGATIGGWRCYRWWLVSSRRTFARRCGHGGSTRK